LAFEMRKLKWNYPEVPPALPSFSAVEFDILFFGYTPAFIVNSSAWAFIHTAKEPPDEITFPSRAIEIPPIISDKTVLATQSQLVWPIFIEPVDYQAVMKGRSFVHFHASVQYRDAFGIERETTVHKRWENSEIPGLSDEWVDYGKNEQT